MESLVVKNGKQVNINISQLVPSQLNTFDASDIDDLLVSIKSCGLLTPLSVIGPDENGNYEILSGERRYRSIMQLNKENPGFMLTVPCYVIGGPEMSETSKKLAIELSNLETRDNFNREGHRFTVLSLYKQMSEDQGTPASKKDMIEFLKNAMKVSDRYSQMYVTVFIRGSEALRNAVVAGADETKEDAHGIPMSVASKVANMDESDQTKVLSHIEAGVDPQIAYDMVKYPNGKEQKPEPTFQDSIASGNSIAPGNSQFTARPTSTEPSGENKTQVLKQEGSIKPKSYFDEDRYLDEEPDYDEEYARAYGESDSDPDFDDDEIEEVEEENEFENMSLGDVEAYFNEHKNDRKHDLTVDTTGLIGKLSSETEKSATRDKEMRRVMTGWVRMINRKLDKNEDIEAEDVELMSSIEELVDKYRAKF